MKTFTTAAFFAFVATLAATAPTPQGSNGFEALITFQGAAGAQQVECSALGVASPARRFTGLVC